MEFLSRFHLSPLKQELFLTNKVNYLPISEHQIADQYLILKFVYSETATKIEEIAELFLNLLSKVDFFSCFHLSPLKQELFLTSKVNYLPTLLKPYSSEILTCISYLLGYNSDQYLILKLIYSENAPKLVEFLSCFHLSPLKQELFLTNKINYLPISEPNHSKLLISI